MKQKFSISWRSVNVDIVEKERRLFKTRSKKKIILNNVSGMSESGFLVAIMGASGAGKTTLLSAISGRLRDKGTFKINRNTVSSDDIKNMSGYVHQQDIFTESLTVLEHLRFMAGLQIGNKAEEKHFLIIKKILSELGLEMQKHTLIKRLSGGEKRRLSLAGQLLNNPCILFCDEPTTGLDSYSAITVIQKLQKIAVSGKIVIATIHQPSSQLYHYFHNIILIAEGKLVFQGTKEEAQSFFESLGLYCPPAYNPAEFYIKCLNHENISNMCRIFEIKEKDIQCDNSNQIIIEIKKHRGCYCELRWLLWRSLIDLKRNKSFRINSYLLVLVELILVSWFFSGVKLTDEDSVQNIQGVLSFVSTELTFTNMYAVINVFPGEVAIFVREINLYSPCSYFMSKIISIIPLCLLSTIIYMTIYFIVLQFLSGFFLWLKMTYMMFLISMTSSSLGLAFSASFSRVEHIDAILGPLELILLLVSGFMLRLDTVSPFMCWIKYLSPFYFGFDSLSNLFWENLNDFGNCTRNATTPCYSNGTEVLENYGIYNKAYDPITYNILFLHILVVVFCFIGFAGILRKKLLNDI